MKLTSTLREEDVEVGLAVYICHFVNDGLAGINSPIRNG
jgi:hypothetical protein